MARWSREAGLTRPSSINSSFKGIDEYLEDEVDVRIWMPNGQRANADTRKEVAAKHGYWGDLMAVASGLSRAGARGILASSAPRSNVPSELPATPPVARG